MLKGEGARMKKYSRPAREVVLAISVTVLGLPPALARVRPADGPPGLMAMSKAYWSGQGQGQARGHHKAQAADQGEDSDEGRGNAPHGARERDHEHGKGAGLRFGAREREIIGGYFANPASNLPPGLAKRGGNLPPGLEKHLEREGTLPPGLQKRLTPLPVDLDRRLPPLPPMYRRGIIAGDVVIMDSRSGLVVDIMYNVLGR